MAKSANLSIKGNMLRLLEKRSFFCGIERHLLAAKRNKMGPDFIPLCLAKRRNFGEVFGLILDFIVMCFEVTSWLKHYKKDFFP